MAILYRRLIVSLLIPYLWRRWRGRSSSRSAAPMTGADAGTAAARAVPGSREVTAGLVVGEEY
jgi:hypothetical protein